VSDLTEFRDHARRMARARHRPDCAVQDPHRPWLKPRPSPDCLGCMPPADQALWSRLADETDAYLHREPEETLL
jgi:hypothetical protein